MPTYEYACQSCGTHIEVFQHFSDEPLSVCSVCGGSLRKVFHPAGILFKGSGFYATDSRSGRHAGKKASVGASDGSGGSDGSGDSSARSGPAKSGRGKQAAGTLAPSSGRAGSGDPAPAAKTSSESGKKSA